MTSSITGDPLQVQLPISNYNPAVPNEAVCPLRPHCESVKTARDFAKMTLQDWGMAELFEDVELVVSELVTNALRYGLLRTVEDRPEGRCSSTHFDQEWPVRLSLLRKGPRVLCAVRDPSSAVPVRKEPDYLAETGRGLHLVESLSREWGCTLQSDGGKVVWALFFLPS